MMSRLKTSLSFLFLLLASTPLVLAAPQPPQPAPAREVAANEVITQPRQQVPGSTGTADTPSPTNTTGSAELASVRPASPDVFSRSYTLHNVRTQLKKSNGGIQLNEKY